VTSDIECLIVIQSAVHLPPSFNPLDACTACSWACEKQLAAGFVKSSQQKQCGVILTVNQNLTGYLF